MATPSHPLAVSAVTAENIFSQDKKSAGRVLRGISFVFTEMSSHYPVSLLPGCQVVLLNALVRFVQGALAYLPKKDATVVLRAVSRVNVVSAGRSRHNFVFLGPTQVWSIFC